MRVLAAMMIALFAGQVMNLTLAMAASVPTTDDQTIGTAARAALGDDRAAVTFDLFFRQGRPPGASAAAPLSITLFGTRVDQSSTRSSAIIATPDGVQSSFVVGEEIVSGTTLTRVSANSVTITHDGVETEIFLDQSSTVRGGGIAATPPVELSAQTPFDQGGSGGSSLASQIGIEPRTTSGQVTGFVINPEGSGQAFRAAGLEPGDVLVAINGDRPRSIEEIVPMLDQISPSVNTSLQIERRGTPMTINM